MNDRRLGLARIELVLAFVFAVLAVTTAMWPTWFESLTGLRPDRGSGETEWGFVVVFATLSVVAATFGWRHHRKSVRA